jgi:undecaprenyl diphosphate synthase
MKDAKPTHIGIIMDGNRRWATSQGLPTLSGHSKGIDVLYSVTKHIFEQGIPFLTVYAFSVENWQRNHKEVNYLMALIRKGFDKYIDKLHESGIKVTFLGDRERLDEKVIKIILEGEEKTRNNTSGTLAICFNYGGHQEIVDATKRIIDDKVPSDEVTTDTLSSYMYAPEIPPVDLIIRTSGENRISGFMLWRAEYSELYFAEKHWPEFTTSDIDEALVEYARRQRRFGK